MTLLISHWSDSNHRKRSYLINSITWVLRVASRLCASECLIPDSVSDSEMSGFSTRSRHDVFHRLTNTASAPHTPSLTRLSFEKKGQTPPQSQQTWHRSLESAQRLWILEEIAHFLVNKIKRRNSGQIKKV